MKKNKRRRKKYIKKYRRTGVSGTSANDVSDICQSANNECEHHEEVEHENCINYASKSEVLPHDVDMDNIRA